MTDQIFNLSRSTAHAVLIAQIVLSGLLLLMATVVRWREAGNVSRALMGISYWWKEIVIAGLVWSILGVGCFWIFMSSGALLTGDVGLFIGAGLWMKKHRAN